jgi:hypothetical protein
MHAFTRTRTILLPFLLSLLAVSGLLGGCAAESTSSDPPQDEPAEETQQETTATESESAPEQEAASTYAWTDIELTDVNTGETFTISEFAGSQVLMQAFAVW